MTEYEEPLKWFQWIETDNYIQKVPQHGSVQEAIDALAIQLPRFLWHAYIKDKQAKAYHEALSLTGEAESDSCVVQMDFAEYSTCQWQDEIQSAHWRQHQIGLYTVMVYHREAKRSIVIASDYRAHGKQAVAALTATVLEMIVKELPTVKHVHLWTDGPSSQFKNSQIDSFSPCYLP